MWLVLPNVGKLSKTIQNYKGNPNFVYYKNRDLRLLLNLLWDEKSNWRDYNFVVFNYLSHIFGTVRPKNKKLILTKRF